MRPALQRVGIGESGQQGVGDVLPGQRAQGGELAGIPVALPGISLGNGSVLLAEEGPGFGFQTPGRPVERGQADLPVTGPGFIGKKAAAAGQGFQKGGHPAGADVVRLLERAAADPRLAGEDASPRRRAEVRQDLERELARLVT